MQFKGLLQEDNDIVVRGLLESVMLLDLVDRRKTAVIRSGLRRNSRRPAPHPPHAICELKTEGREDDDREHDEQRYANGHEERRPAGAREERAYLEPDLLREHSKRHGQDLGDADGSCPNCSAHV